MLSTDSLFQEVVLFLLLESFKFSPGRQEIYWEATAFPTPRVFLEDGQLSPRQMPIRIEPIIG